jgi:hypothetical protein
MISTLKQNTMKKSLTTILILITLAGYSQPLMLSVRKATVQAEMRQHRDFIKITNFPDYIEYQRGTDVIAYEFERDGGKWICIKASIEMAKADEDKFIESKTGCNCWTLIEDDTWLYETNLFDTPVLVKRTYNGESVKFTYTFAE